MPLVFCIPQGFLDKFRGFSLGGSSKKKSVSSMEPTSLWPQSREPSSNALAMPQWPGVLSGTAQVEPLSAPPVSDSWYTCSSTSSVQSSAFLSLPSPPPTTWGLNIARSSMQPTLPSVPGQIYDANGWLLTADEENRVRANLAELDANAEATLSHIRVIEQAIETWMRNIRHTSHQPNHYYSLEVKNMHAQLLEAYHQLNVTRAQQEDIEACKATMRNIIHPLRKIPWEILQLIFESLRDEVAHTDLASALPFLLSMVCRKWRHVAHNTPALWTSVKLDVRSGAASWSMDCVSTWDRFKAAKRYDALVNERVSQQLQLARPESRNIQLKLVFHDNACICARRSGYKRILPIVRQAIFRAESVNIIISNSLPTITGPCECITELFSVAAIPGKLSTFAFSSVLKQDRLFYIHASTFCFAAIDSVRRLEFYNAFPRLNYRQVFAKVTVVNIHLPKVGLNLASLDTILAGAPNAESLMLSCRALDPATGPLPTISRHDKLKHFSVRTKRLVTVSAAHVVFILPQLQQLKLDFPRGGDTPIHSVHAEAQITLMKFIVSGSNALDAIILRGMDAGALLADAITAPEFPRISKLVLTEGLLSGEFWTRLETQLTTVSPTRMLVTVECHNMAPTEAVAVQQLVNFLDMQRQFRKVWTTNGILADTAPSVKVHVNPPWICIGKDYPVIRDATTRETLRCRKFKQLEIDVATQLEERLKEQWEPVTTMPIFETAATQLMTKLAGVRRSHYGAVGNLSPVSRPTRHRRRTAARD